MTVKNYFQTGNLTERQHSHRPTKSYVRKSVLSKINFNIIFFRYPGLIWLMNQMAIKVSHKRLLAYFIECQFCYVLLSSLLAKKIILVSCYTADSSGSNTSDMVLTFCKFHASNWWLAIQRVLVPVKTKLPLIKLSIKVYDLVYGMTACLSWPNRYIYIYD